MNILFVHQNFPGQYRHIVRVLASRGHRLRALGIQSPAEAVPHEVNYFTYKLDRGNARDIHPWALETESKVLRAEACARQAYEMKKEGFTPDLICVHPGWGESLFLRTIWPDVPVLCYQEFFYQVDGFDLDFDPELQDLPTWREQSRTLMKNAYLHLALDQSSWNVSATDFQRSSFPAYWQQCISVIHDGIDTRAAAPDAKFQSLVLADKIELSQGELIVTFVNRRLEPYRGCHSFIRSIPHIQNMVPEAKIVIVGLTEGVSYGAPCPQGEWKDHFLAEIDGRYDPSRVHFAGPLAYKDYLGLLKLSACHVYLTYPFVLSWSLLEAMSTACAVVGSSTAPVQEVIRDGKNGLLVDFFNPYDLAAAVAEILLNRDLAAALGAHARETVVRQYSLEQCVPRHLALMELVASRALGR